jgi:hypothetical protein
MQALDHCAIFGFSSPSDFTWRALTMPMTIAGEYLYFLMVTLLYGAPVALIALVLAWRAGQFGRAVMAVVIALPLIAGIVQIGFHLTLVSMGREYEATQASIEAWLGAGQGETMLDGVFLGQEDLRPGVPANHYLFPLPETLGDGAIEVWLPVDRAHQPGRLVLGDHPGRENGVIAPARLLFHPRTRSLNAAVVPGRYFNEFYPSLDREALGAHTLIAKILPRSSAVIHPYEPPRADRWRYTRMQLIMQ